MYSVVLTDRSYTPQAELRNVSDLTFFRGVNKLATCGFKVQLDSDQVDRLTACDGFIKLYRKGSLVFYGPIVSAEESADHDTQAVAINCADAGWALGHRVGGKSTTGDIWSAVTPRHTIAQTLIDNQNTFSETGISTSAYVLSSGSSITYKFGPYGLVLPGIQELGGALDGFDWLMRPVENWVNGAVTGAKIAGFQAQSIIGAEQDNVVFEYGIGTRSNVLAYTITTTRDQQANQVFHVNPNDASDVKTGDNAAAEAYWGYLQDIVSSDITDAAMRQSLVDEHASVRGNPRTLIQMTPHIDPGALGRVPEPFVEYDAGDTITFRAAHAGRVRFAGLVRVYGITATLENTGFERIELTLEDDS